MQEGPGLPPGSLPLTGRRGTAHRLTDQQRSHLAETANAVRPPPPLAFVKAVVTDVSAAASGGGFALAFDAWLEHADSALPRDLSGQTEVAAATDAAKARAFAATALRSKASIALEQAGFDVPPDRVPVVLF